MKFLLILNFCWYPFVLFAQVNPFISSDNDEDLMDDAWEIEHGLNPNDPTDAFLDSDQDAILNIDEFYFDGLPNDAQSPLKVKVDPNNMSVFINLYAALMDSESSVVLQLAEGEYALTNDIWIQQKNVGVYIQGGWNSDFTEYNPTIYQSLIHYGGQENLILFDNQPNRRSAYALDGLTIINGDKDIQFKTTNGDSRILVKDCTFLNFGASFPIREILSFSFLDNGRGKIDIIRTLIANSTADGCSVINHDIGSVSMRLINSTITGLSHVPGSFEFYGNCIRPSLGENSNLEIECINSTLWGNDGAHFFFSGISDDNFNISARHSNIDLTSVTTISNTQFIEDLGNNIYVDPLFKSTSDNNFDLTKESPCINAGSIIGLPYIDQYPEIGAKEFDPSTSVSNLFEELNIEVFPNPANESITFSGLIKDKDVELMIYNWTKNLVHSISLTIGEFRETVQVRSWPSGIYYYSTNEKDARTYKLVVTH